MFDKKEEIQQAVDAVYEATTGLERGEVLGHDTITEILGLRPHEGFWNHIVGKVRRRLGKERGIAMWPNHVGGYKLCTKAEQLELAAEWTRRGLRRVRRGRQDVESLPERGLSDHQRRTRLFLSESMRETERTMRRNLKAQTEEVRPTPVIPRRPEI